MWFIQYKKLDFNYRGELRNEVNGWDTTEKTPSEWMRYKEIEEGPKDGYDYFEYVITFAIKES